MEIKFKKKDNPRPVYDYAVKQEWEEYVYYECPAKLTEAEQKAMEKIARATFWALDCRDVARVDMRMDADGRIYVLEVNPLPGLTPDYSDLVLIAKACGMEYDQLIAEIMLGGLRRMREKRREERELEREREAAQAQDKAEALAQARRPAAAAGNGNGAADGKRLTATSATATAANGNGGANGNGKGNGNGEGRRERQVRRHRARGEARALRAGRQRAADASARRPIRPPSRVSRRAARARRRTKSAPGWQRA